MITRFYRINFLEKADLKSSYKQNLAEDGQTKLIEVQNSDLTGTNDYSLVKITCDTAEECDLTMQSLVYDGKFNGYAVSVERLGIEVGSENEYFNYMWNSMLRGLNSKYDFE